MELLECKSSKGGGRLAIRCKNDVIKRREIKGVTQGTRPRLTLRLTGGKALLSKLNL